MEHQKEKGGVIRYKYKISRLPIYQHALKSRTKVSRLMEYSNFLRFLRQTILQMIFKTPVFALNCLKYQENVQNTEG
jgi:hypothetical protein